MGIYLHYLHEEMLNKNTLHLISKNSQQVKNKLSLFFILKNRLTKTIF